MRVTLARDEYVWVGKVTSWVQLYSSGLNFVRTSVVEAARIEWRISDSHCTQSTHNYTSCKFLTLPSTPNDVISLINNGSLWKYKLHRAAIRIPTLFEEITSSFTCWQEAWTELCIWYMQNKWHVAEEKSLRYIEQICMVALKRMSSLVGQFLLCISIEHSTVNRSLVCPGDPQLNYTCIFNNSTNLCRDPTHTCASLATRCNAHSALMAASSELNLQTMWTHQDMQYYARRKVVLLRINHVVCAWSKARNITVPVQLRPWHSMKLCKATFTYHTHVKV